MCGFAGIVGFEHSAVRSDKILESMGDMLKYRGPDEQQIYSDKYISFVFRRLAILDLDNGTQPIWNSDRTVFISVNGEIYNHLELRNKYFADTHFQSSSDSEIVLHLYLKFGEKLFDKLNGMFAIAIWDSRTDELILARDRLGIKPLYYALGESGLIFGSELKALLAHPDCPRKLNWQELANEGVQDRAVIPSYVVGVNHFRAGCFAKYSIKTKNQIILQPFWKLENHLINESSISSKNAREKYAELLEDSLSLRLMSDVPIGLFLSGGIDSSILAALASKSNRNVHCFTVIENATYNSGDAKNAKNICEKYGLTFHPIVFNLKQMLNNFDLKQLEKMVVMIESPRFDLEWYYKSELHKAAKAIVPEMKVILLGQGADEFAGGYSHYLGSNFSNWKEYLNGNVLPANLNSFASENHIPNRFNLAYPKETHSEEGIHGYKEKMLRFSYQLQHFNLWHEDRTSSFFGMESRVPFLDHRIVELLASLPSSLHEELFWNKNIVRQCGREIVKDYPPEHPKVPFFVTSDNNTIANFAIGACKNIYEDFTAKYSNKSTGMGLNWERTNRLYDKSQKQNSASGKFAWELIELMCVEIFKNFCESPFSYMNEQDHSLNEHYPQLRVEDWNYIDSILGSDNLFETNLDDESTLISIPDECEILNPLTEDDSKTALALTLNGEQISRIEIPDSHIWIVMLLDEMGRHLENPKSLKYWSEKTKIHIHTLAPVVQNLYNGGFLIVVKQTKER